MISGTITDASGRTLSSQITKTFYNSLRHTKQVLVHESIQSVLDSLNRKVTLLTKDISAEIEINDEITVMVKMLLPDKVITMYLTMQLSSHQSYQSLK